MYKQTGVSSKVKQSVFLGHNTVMWKTEMNSECILGGLILNSNILFVKTIMFIFNRLIMNIMLCIFDKAYAMFSTINFICLLHLY